MKKTTIFILATFATFFIMSSCKKDYSCRCTITYGGISQDTTFSVGNVTKKDAKSQCNDFESTYKGLIVIFGGDLDCGVE